MTTDKDGHEITSEDVEELENKLAIAVKALETPCPNCPYHIPAGHTVCTKCGAIIGEIQQHDLPDFARFENRSNTTTDVDK